MDNQMIDLDSILTVAAWIVGGFTAILILDGLEALWKFVRRA